MKTQDPKLEAALYHLNTLIAQGWGFPEAMHRVLRCFAVSENRLAKRYDSQFDRHE